MKVQFLLSINYIKDKHVTFSLSPFVSSYSACETSVMFQCFCTWVICTLECKSAYKTLMRNLYSVRENTLHALQQEGRNLGMRRPLVTEMVIALPTSLFLPGML